MKLERAYGRPWGLVRDSWLAAAASDVAAMAYWRAFGRRDGDVFLCSYPKSGRTWLRFLLTYYQLRLADVPFRLTLRSFPELSPNLTLFSAFRLRDPPAGVEIRRLLGSHSELPRLFRRQRVIVLRRDLRDVLVSYYYHRRARREIDDDLESFLASPWGLRHAIRYANRWTRGLAAFPPGQVLELTYERLHDDPAGAAGDCLRFIGLEVREALVAEAVAYAAADNMRRLEARWGTPDFPAAELERDESAFQVRQARVGGHRRELSAATRTRLAAALREGLLDPGGYDYR